MKIIFLHLSDIHIRGEADPILAKAQAIASALNGGIVSASMIVIIVSGDVAYSGKKEEYKAAEKFLKEISSAISSEVRCPVNFLISPGNHDCDFDLNDATRDNNIAAMNIGSVIKIDDSVIKSCTKVQNEFFKFRDRLECWTDAVDDGLWRSVQIQIDDKTIRFDSLNVSWVSRIREDKNLFYPVDRYVHKAQDQSAARFVVMHHPLNWYSQRIYRPFRKLVRQTASIVISGHEHEGNVGILDDQESDKSAYIEGCVLQHDKGDLGGTGFHVVKIDLDSLQFSSARYLYSKGRYLPGEEDVWANFRDLPVPLDNELKLKDEFRRMLDDPGALLKQSTSNAISLSDTYVYPDMQRMHSGGKIRQFVDAKKFLDPATIAGGVIVESDERMGSSSFLYQIYKEYLEKGFAPLLVRGSDIKRASDNEVESLIKKTIKQQYREGCVEQVIQLSRSKKVLLVDDFDDSPLVDAEARAKVLGYLMRACDYVVVTTSKSFELKEILEKDTTKELLSLEHYQLQPFGFSKRSELVQRWFSIGYDGTVSEADFIGRCDKAEKLISSVMDKSLIPSAPLYLLALLQSTEAGRSAELKESALGHYYQFLLSEAFQNAKVLPAKLTEHFQYVTQLSWEFHKRKTQEISHFEFVEFNSAFTAEWTTIELEPMIRTLFEARVLQKIGENYAFRYPYMFYHLKGKYISENLSDDSVREYVRRCCNHLYVRDNANTILFLAHHTNDDWLLNTIAGALGKLFEGYMPVKFDGDTDGINNLISEAPALTYKGGAPQQHRARKNKIRDEMDSPDGLSDCEENTSDLSLAAQITMLLKTAEILGQVLKNQYSTIKRGKKRDLIGDLFNGSLRALARFYRSFERGPERLVSSVKSAMENAGRSSTPEERDAAARKIVAEIVQAVTVGLLAQAARSANSDDLAEDTRAIVQANGSRAFKLIELAVLLDSAKPIPRVMLENLYISGKDDIVVSRIIKILVLGRLYMFKTAESDMKWLSSKLKIDIDAQHNISYQQAGRKLN